jgi:concanavalin A-like lectin/glucanase superfamily protein
VTRYPSIAALIGVAATITGSAGFAQPTSYLEAPASAAYDVMPSGFTVECWIRVRSLAGQNPRVAFAWNSSIGFSYWQFFVFNRDCCTGTVVFDITPQEPIYCQVRSSSRVDDGSWHHLAGTYDGSDMRLFIDGALEAAQTYGAISTNLSGGAIRVGQINGEADQFDGQIDELRIWNVARTASEIQANEEQEIAVQTGLVAYWRFDGGSTDLASGNTLSPVGNVTICDCGGQLGGSADIWSPTACPNDTCLCPIGTMNAASGFPADVLFVNSSAGDFSRHVTVGVGSPLSVTLATSPVGPAAARYVLWVWTTGSSTPVRLDVGSSTIGCLVNPTPFQPFLSPQPFRCVVGGMPRAFAAGVPVLSSPRVAPWTLTRSTGFATQRTLTLQGVLEDQGALGTDGFSTTNAVTLVVR